MQEKLVQNFLQYLYYKFTENICSACNPAQVVVFCKDALIL